VAIGEWSEISSCPRSLSSRRRGAGIQNALRMRDSASRFACAEWQNPDDGTVSREGGTHEG